MWCVVHDLIAVYDPFYYRVIILCQQSLPLPVGLCIVLTYDTADCQRQEVTNISG
jgi:hypothetical protein